MNTSDTLQINKKGRLETGGCDTVELAERFGTPLYVFNRAEFEKLSDAMLTSVKKYYGDGEIAYASKAFACEAVYTLAKRQGLHVDVVSGGELYLALKSGFNPSKIYFHGNAKTHNELKYAVTSGVGAIVLESASEAEKISAIAKEATVRQGVMIRINPGVEAHTHSYVQTALTDSKFGIQLDDEKLTDLIKNIVNDNNLNFVGLHVHIGSQIFDITPYKIVLEKMVKYIKFLENEGVTVKKLNLGGGFGITYTESDPTFSEADYRLFIEQLSIKLLSLVNEYDIVKPTLVFEPGRSLVGSAGITLYKVCAIKDIKDVRKYVSVDGGMSDNPRHALYGSRYEATVCDRADEKKTQTVTIAGKCCESGDIITSDVALQSVNEGDFIAVLATGAYNYSMSSNYNCNLIPPVVMVYDGKAEYIVKPQTYEDLARNNVVPDSLK